MLTHIDVSLPFMTCRGRELSIMFEKSEGVLGKYLPPQFYKVMWRENIVCAGATMLHYFVYFSILKFLPKIQFTSETREIWGHSQVL